MRFALASSLALCISIGMSCAFAADSPPGSHRFEVTPLNSPVRADNANFKLKLPEGMTADRASYRIEVVQTSPKLTSNIPSGQIEVQFKSEPQGVTASIPVGEIAPGKFIAHFKIKPSKEWWSRIREFLKIADSDNKSDPGELHGQASFEIDASLEVPDPGKAGKLTLEGIDSDQDGVRDDVQRWINTAFSDSEKTRRALKQYAKQKQVDIISAPNPERSISISRQLFDTTNCLQYVFQGLGFYEVLKKLNAKVTNTAARLKADNKADANFHGQYYRLPRRQNLKDFCNFDVDSLEN